MPELTEPIKEQEIEAQAWKYYFLAVLWPLFLFTLPFVYVHTGWFFALYLIFPGVYLFNWTGYLMHEAWHGYVPNVNNYFFYNLLALMLFTDPQVYKILHGFHHSQVNTYDDNEFHPFGRIGNRAVRAFHGVLEIVLGIAYLSLSAQVMMPSNERYKDKYKAWKSFVSLVAIIAFMAAVGYLSAKFFNLRVMQVAVPLFLTVWIGSIFVHLSQMVEHGNVIVEGDYRTRNVRTRNLKPSGTAEKIFLFLTHGDSREHVLHHTQVKIYSRPFPGRLPMPPEARYITIREFLGVLKDIATGKEDIIKQA